MSTDRTLSERPELFRTPRSRKEAGMLGPIDTKVPSAEYVALLKAELEREQATEKAPFGFFGMLILAVLVGAACWAGLVMLFGGWS